MFYIAKLFIFRLLVFPLSVACQVERKKGYMISHLLLYLERAGDSLILALPFVSCDLRLFSSTMIVAYTRVIHCLIYRQTSGKSSPPPLQVSPLCESRHRLSSCERVVTIIYRTITTRTVQPTWVSCSYFRKLVKRTLWTSTISHGNYSSYFSLLMEPNFKMLKHQNFWLKKLLILCRKKLCSFFSEITRIPKLLGILEYKLKLAGHTTFYIALVLFFNWETVNTVNNRIINYNIIDWHLKS